MRLFISLFILFASFYTSVAFAASTEPAARFDGQGTLTGPSASGTTENDATIAGMCDNCATMAGSNAFADCTNPKCRSSILRGALPDVDASTGKTATPDDKSK